MTAFGGEERFATEPARLFQALTDLELFADNVPNLISAERVDERTLKCAVKPGFSFLRGTLKLTITLTESNPPEEAAMDILAQGIGASMQVVSRMKIAPEGSGSRLNWQADVQRVSGLLATVPGSLVKAAADHTIRHAWQQIREKLGEPPADAAT